MKKLLTILCALLMIGTIGLAQETATGKIIGKVFDEDATSLDLECCLAQGNRAVAQADLLRPARIRCSSPDEHPVVAKGKALARLRPLEHDEFESRLARVVVTTRSEKR